MRRDDPRFCDGTNTCKNALDEPFDYCRPVVVIGSDQMDGVYKTIRANTYKQMGGVNLIHKVGRGWQDGQGNPMPLVKIFKILTRGGGSQPRRESI